MQKSKFKIAEMLTYEQVFDDKPLSTIEYVKMIGKEKVIMLSSFFINRDVVKMQNNPKKFIYDFLTPENIVFADKLVERLITLFGQNLQSSPISILNFINEISLYHIIETALSLPPTTDFSTKILPNDKIVFIKMCLGENTIHISRQASLFKSEYNSWDEAIRDMTACQIADWDYSHVRYAENCMTQMLKCVCFFKFLEQSLPIHLQKFYLNNNIKSWKEYAQCISFLILRMIKNDNHGKIILSPDISNYEQVVGILDRLSSSKYDEEDDFDFTRLRDQPLYKICNDTYLVLSKLFLAEKLFKSLYFEFRDINDRIKDDSHINHFKSYIGSHFTEEYLCNEILLRCFPQRFVQKTGKDFRDQGFKDGEPDFYTRNRNKVFLFECKDALFNSSIKVSYNMESIMNEIRDKLYYTVNNKGKVKNKAILQLIRNAKRLLDDSIIDSQINPKYLRIYPIIIVHDKAFTTPGINWILNQWFKEEVNKNYPELIGHISSIFLINIDTFILIKSRLQSRKIILENLLDSYNKHILSKKEILDPKSFTNYAYSVLFEPGDDTKILIDELKILL